MNVIYIKLPKFTRKLEEITGADVLENFYCCLRNMKWGRYGFDSKKFGIVAGGGRGVVTACVVEEIMKVKQNPESFL